MQMWNSNTIKKVTAKTSRIMKYVVVVLNVVQIIFHRAAESESKQEMESVGVNCFRGSRCRIWSWQNFVDSDSGMESPTDNQWTIIATKDNSYIPPKSLEDKRLLEKMNVERRM